MGQENADKGQDFPLSSGILFGLGFGGFFDGIVLHQLLQWHHLLTSAGYPPDNVENLKVNTFWDGLFHSLTYVFVVLGLVILWRAARRTHIRWSSKLLLGTFLIGFGLFNLVEGTISHQILGIHHVNETGPRDQWLYWDLGFLAWGAVMLVAAQSRAQRSEQFFVNAAVTRARAHSRGQPEDPHDAPVRPTSGRGHRKFPSLRAAPARSADGWWSTGA